MTHLAANLEEPGQAVSFRRAPGQADCSVLVLFAMIRGGSSQYTDQENIELAGSY